MVHASQLPTARRRGGAPNDTGAPTSATQRAETEPAKTRATKTRATKTQPVQESHADQDSLALGRYRLGARLGAGSFGTVFRARDERLDREVAVKVLPRERIMDARFEREAHAAARLSHPAIVTLYEAIADQESAYLVSELVRGATLDKLLEAGRLSDRDIVAIGIALCDALAHAHSEGIVHRDVKPSNILVPDRPASAAYPAKLTDFGVARVIGGDSLTRTGDVIGTDAYMAPEQAAGRETGAAADLYALALVLYEALTGVNPVTAGSSSRRSARVAAYLPALRRQRRELPKALGQGIDLALRPRPRERGTVIELQEALSSALDELSDVPGVVEGPWRPWSQRADRADPLDPAGMRMPGGLHGPDPPRRPDRQLGPRAGSTQRDPDAGDTLAVPWLERGLGCVCGGLLSAWLATHVLSTATLTPAGVGLLAAGLLLLLPRLGFGLIALLVVVAAAVQGHGGEAVLLGVAALIPILVLPRAGTAWPLAAAAPALGVLGLAGAWPALAARAGSAWRRAALGLVGWMWLVLAVPLSGSALFFGRAPGTPSRSVWAGSPYETIHHVLGPILSTGMLVPALVWAIAALVLPALVRGRSLALDTVCVVAWSAAVLSSTELTLRAGSHEAPVPHTVVLGAVAAGLVALVPPLIAAWRSMPRPAEPRSEAPRPGLLP